MTTTGPNFPSTASNDGSFGFASWTNPGNVTANDSSYATLANNDSDTNYIKATGFGFSIGVNEAIDGIAVTINRKCTGGCTDRSIKLVKGGTIGGTDKSASAVWSGSFASYTVGGSTELWGRTWTYADINASDFGVAFAALMSDSIDTASVNYVTITIYHHTEAPPADAAVLISVCNPSDEGRVMKKNVAGQKIGAQIIDATGSAYTSTVTVYVTGDAGTQALGSVGSGVCTHEGNGYHTYSPSQAETNYDIVAFTFVGGVPVTRELSTQMDANIVAINGNTGGVAAFDRATRCIVTGAVTGSPTTTSIPTTGLAPAAAVTDQFKGQVLQFDEDTATANLRGQKTEITGSSSGGTLTVTALTTAPTSGDTFTIQ